MAAHPGPLFVVCPLCQAALYDAPLIGVSLVFAKERSVVNCPLWVIMVTFWRTVEPFATGFDVCFSMSVSSLCVRVIVLASCLVFVRFAAWSDKAA